MKAIVFEINSKFFEGNPSSMQNVVLENCKGRQIEIAFGFLSDETWSYGLSLAYFFSSLDSHYNIVYCAHLLIYIYIFESSLLIY